MAADHVREHIRVNCVNPGTVATPWIGRLLAAAPNAWMGEQWDGPFLLKGITRIDDAKRAADTGVTAISVSNHGGNNLDGTPATIRCLPGIAETVGDQGTAVAMRPPMISNATGSPSAIACWALITLSKEQVRVVSASTAPATWHQTASLARRRCRLPSSSVCCGALPSMPGRLPRNAA
jgi:NAD(P)-dependent dehydrogenase (short-subunit alcohol dehydrogenase family)